MKIKRSKKDKCPCESGLLFGDCCLNNPLKMWFLNRVGCRMVDERTGAELVIKDDNHAIQLYELASAGDSFKDI